MFGDYGWLAPLALLAIPLFAVLAFRGRRPAAAATLVALGVALFAPELAHVKLPLTPPLDKGNIPYLVMLAMIFVRFRKLTRDQKPFTGEEIFALVSALACVATAMTNTDPLSFGTWRRTSLPGMSIKDGLALSIDDLFSIWAPFYVGRVFIRDPRDLRDLLAVLAGAGIVYAPFALFEVRMSPQLHYSVYGFAAHSDFAQSIRWGGYRPMVFMAHGLAVGLFVCAAALAAVLLTRVGEPIGRFRAKRVAIGLAILLVLCKSTGAIAYFVVLAPMLLKLSPRALVRVAQVLGVLVITYPALRAYDLFPVDDLLAGFSSVSADRTESLAFRFENENMLLERAQERLAFGWGSYGRNAVYDPEMGKEQTVTDGQWIIWLGTRGIVGLLCFFGLVLAPVFRLGRHLDEVKDKNVALLLSGLALVIAILVTDLIPNGLFSAYPLFLAGALSGLTRRGIPRWRNPQNVV